MRYLLNVAYGLLITVSLPWLLWSAVTKGKYRRGLGCKLLGNVPQLPAHPCRVWLHAVSVGEVNLLPTIVDRLKQSRPDVQCVISTTTDTGYRLAQQRFPDHTVFYCPLDFSWAVQRALTRIRPQLLVLAELELWPNLMSIAHQRGVPLAIVNGRLSDRSARGYARIGGVMRHCLQGVQLVAAQSDRCAAGFRNLGVPADKVHAVGSVKFDGARTDRNNPLTQRLRRLAGLRDDQLVFLAGSTQAPEEALALRVFHQLQAKHPQLRLILVPRHPERTPELVELLDASGFAWQRRSQMSDDAAETDGTPEETSPRILLVDTVGELGGWWGAADVGFVGGSMGSRGGQNMLEPAAYGVATCFGPKTRNFRDVVQLLLQHEAAEVVQDGGDLQRFVAACLESPEKRQRLGTAAQQLVLQQRGAADATIELLTQLLPAAATVATERAA